jgi:hypothetical protein
VQFVADDRNAGLEALQAATLQLITAARQVLDAAEQVVRDPDTVGQVAQSLATVAKAAVQLVAPPSASAGSAAPGQEPFEHIDLG